MGGRGRKFSKLDNQTRDKSKEYIKAHMHETPSQISHALTRLGLHRTNGTEIGVAIVKAYMKGFNGVVAARSIEMPNQRAINVIVMSNELSPDEKRQALHDLTRSN